MAAVCTTENLLALRRRLCATGPEGRTDVENRLSRLRANTQGTLHHVTTDGLMDRFHAVWDALSSAGPRDWLYLPPIYEDESLREILRIVVKSLWQRERGLVTDSTNNVGHTVFGGVEGTGKTTLLKALLLAVAVLFERMIPVTHCFTAASNDVAPAELLCAANHVLHSTAADIDTDHAYTDEALMSALAQLREGDHELFLCLDEFQYVLELEPIDNVRRRTIVASQAATLSRSYGTYGVIAGSSADMRVRMFRSGTSEAPDPWRRVGFTDFNASLYQLVEVPALRTLTSLRRYVQRRYPRWEMDETDVAELLHWTGGIGRLIHFAWVQSDATPDGSLAGVAGAVRALQGIAGADGHRRLPPARALDDPAARVAVTAIVSRSHSAIVRDAGSARRTLPCVGMRRTELLLALRAMHVDAPEAHMRRLVDQSVLYAAGEDVQLARSCDAHVYLDAGVPSNTNLVLLTAVAMMVRGVACGDVDEDAAAGAVAGDAAAVATAAGAAVTHVNAGFALERLARSGIWALMDLPRLSAERRRDGWRVKSEPSLQFSPPGSAEWQALTPDLLRDLDGQLASWKNEIGLDGVAFVRRNAASASAPETWLLHGWQSKGGHSRVEITGGELATSVNILVRDGNVGSVDDSTSHGILVKAQVGMCKLLVAWHRAMETAFPQQAASKRPQLLPASLLITTTKNARLAKKSISKLSKLGASMRIDKQVAAVVGFPTSRSPWVKAALDADMSVKLLDGVSWVPQCVPRDVYPLAVSWFPPEAADDALTDPSAAVGDAHARTRPRDGCRVM